MVSIVEASKVIKNLRKTGSLFLKGKTSLKGLILKMIRKKCVLVNS